MTFFLSWPISRRLAAVLSIILGLSVLCAVLSAVRLQELGQQLHTMTETNLRTERNVNDWMARTGAGVVRATAIARSGDSALVEYFAPITAANSAAITEIQKTIAAQITTPEAKAMFTQVEQDRKVYLAMREVVTKLRKQGDPEGALKEFTARYEPAAQRYLASLGDLAHAQRAQFDAAALHVEELRVSTIRLLAVTTAVSLLLGIVLAVVLTRSITVPLREAVGAAQAIGNMDLSAPAASHYRADETGQLMRAIDTMRHALHDALSHVRGAVENIATASDEIAAGNQDLSDRTEQAADSLQRTTGAMETLTGTVRSNVESADQANRLVGSASSVAQRGGEVVNQVISTMHEINESSKTITNIIATIDGIAFQTNILALNAAVEAARAGEQGRGFAVVAGEVRNLAQRSAAAAHEIKDLIGTSVDKVEAGTRLVQDAGGTMDEIVASVGRVSGIIDEISRVARSQNAGIDEVGRAVTMLDTMTQQNAALSEESTAAAASLSHQTARLRDVVNAFKLSAGGAAAGSGRRRLPG
jgi:methyl-accepting chemotaxis protein